MVSDWKYLKLADIVNIIGGGTPKRSVEEYWGGDIPWLSVKDFNNDFRWVSHSDEKITELGLQKSSTKLLSEGQIIISARGTVGELAQVIKPMAFNQSCYGIDAKPDYTINDFLYYLLKNSLLNIQRVTHGAVFDTITRDTFNYIEVSLPPIPEQKTIAHILGTLDHKIELNRQMNETLEAMAQALFKSWFIDFDPVIDNALLAGNDIPDELAQRVELRQAQLNSDIANPKSEINELFPSEFEFTEELGWIPKGWSVRSMTEVADFQNGYAFYKTGYSEFGYKVVDLANIHTEGRFVETHRDKYISPEVYHLAKHEKHHLHKNDIVMAMTDMTQAMGILGKCGKIYESNKYILNQRIGRIRVKKDINVNFLMTYLNSSYQLNFLKMRALGTVQKYVNTTHIKEMKFVIPNERVMNKFGDFVDPQFNRMREADEGSETLAKLRDTLLPKLMSGELRIADAEKLVEEAL